MRTIGRVDTLWRYPVKSMRGEQLQQSFAGFGGVFGDRWYAFLSSKAIAGFPYLTGREKSAMLLYTPQYRHPDRMREPANLAAAEALGPGVTPLYPPDSDQALDVLTPDGQRLPVDDPRLIEMLRRHVNDEPDVALHRSHRAMTDCRPISLFSLQTARELGREVGVNLDIRRFRASINIDLEGMQAFEENQLVGRNLRLGDQVIVAVTGRDTRCKMITLDPDTGEANPEVIKVLARLHETQAGLYAVVIAEGTIRPGDSITVLD